MNALEICVISVISVRKNILRGYFHEEIFYSDAIMYSMNALEICVISVISVRKNILRGYFHAGFTDTADFLFRCYYV